MVTLTYMPTEHVPVLAAEVIRFASPEPGDTVVDCTFGGGGHSRLIADRIGPDGLLICVDRDPAALDRYEQLAHEAVCETRFLRTDFVAALEELAGEGVQPDVILFDLGVSSMQIDAWERGFSYSFDAPLDMRMDPDGEISAQTILNEWPEARIAETLRNYGEEKHARTIAREVVARRPLETTSDFVDAVRAGVPPKVRFGRGNPAKRSFQAIRIAVNAELEELDAALPTAWDLLAPGGRLAAISFHSLEDRRVKRFLVDRATGCICPPEFPVCRCGQEPEAELITRGGVAPSPGEVADNARSASAHLRVARKLDSTEEDRED
jgi:16S rRNA (cytosine1402-N4)-methyltransferase